MQITFFWDLNVKVLFSISTAAILSSYCHNFNKDILVNIDAMLINSFEETVFNICFNFTLFDYSTIHFTFYH